MNSNFKWVITTSGTPAHNLLIFSLVLLMTVSCTLKQGKKLYTIEKSGKSQQFKIVLKENERKNLNGEKLNFSKLTYYRADGTIENQAVNSTVIYNDKVFDISTKEPVKHFPFTILIHSLSKSDSGIAVNLESNRFIRKAFIRKDYSSLLAFTVIQPAEDNKNIVLKMVFSK